MSEIVAVIGYSAAGLYAAILATAWYLDAGHRGRRERALFFRWAAFDAVLMAAVAGWVTAGIATFVDGSLFWRGAWAGASAVLWGAYVPWLIWIVRAGRREAAAAGAEDASAA
jgi:hypothetical protein